MRFVSAVALAVLLPSAASAADLPMLKSSEPLPPDCVTNWTGFYLGAHTGLAFGSSDWSHINGQFNEGDRKASGLHEGLLLGLQGGYNFQIGRFLLGVEGDASYSPFDSEANIGGRNATAPSTDYGRTRTDALASLSARFGYTFGPALLFTKIGAAYAHDRYSTGPLYFNDQTINTATANRFGWVGGLGIEYALGRNWSAKLEYDYYFLGDRNINLSGSPGTPGSQATAKLSRNDQIVKFGLNYNFSDRLEPCCSIIPDFSGEFGLRAGLGTNTFQKDLFYPGSPHLLTSRIKYSNTVGAFSEVFGNINFKNGVFARAYLNGIDIFSGRRRNEDFIDTPFSFDTGFHSNTDANVRSSRGVQGAVDIGYVAFKGDNWNLGGYLGYELYQRRMNAMGCIQIGNGSSCRDPMPSDKLVHSQSEVWHGARVGIKGDYQISDAIGLSGSVTYLPYVMFNGRDNHWLRRDINSMSEHADPGQGLELEGVVSYAITTHVSVGVGGRYTWLKSGDGYTKFPGADARSSEKFRSQQLGGFLQLSYRFGDLARK